MIVVTYFISGGRKHKQVPAYPWKSHLCPIRTGTNQEEGLHTLQRVCPYMVREQCACAYVAVATQYTKVVQDMCTSN